MPRNLLSAPALQKQKRAVTKTVCYRLFMLLITVTVALVVVGDVGDALNIGLATNLLKTGIITPTNGSGTASGGAFRTKRPGKTVTRS